MKQAYCYCCRTEHPLGEMQRIRTRSGWRWRCLRSIEASRRGVDERDHFGRQQTERNREAARRHAEYARANTATRARADPGERPVR